MTTTYEKDQADIARREVRGARWAVGGVLVVGIVAVLIIALTGGSAQDEAPEELTPGQKRLVAALALEHQDADTIEALCAGLWYDPERLEYARRVTAGEHDPIDYEVWVKVLEAKCGAPS